jgi:Arc/MetJ-type ribon-helix-helix transcriptional regulator
MTIHLPEDQESSLRAAGDRGRFASVDDAVAEAVRAYFREARPDGAETKAGPAEREPIWEAIQEIAAEVPDEVWDALPTDLSEQHDHYIYGTPKRPAR